MTPRCGRSPQRCLESESELVGKPLPKERMGEGLGEDERFVKRRKQPDTTAPHSPIAGKIARITRSISMTMGGDDADSGVLGDERQERGGHGESLNVKDKPDEQKELSGTIHHNDNEDNASSTNKKMEVAMPPTAFPAPDFAGDPSLIDSLAEKLNGMPPFWSDFECFVYENSNDTRSAARVLEAFNAKHSALIKSLNLEQIDRLCGEIAKLFLSEETIQSAPSETLEAAAATTTTTSI